MTYTYKLLGNHTEPSIVGTPIEFILRKEDNKDNTWIPKDPANTDYQQYLEWAKTNTADPAD